jgi:TetR/AcrR family transcriptional regulator
MPTVHDQYSKPERRPRRSSAERRDEILDAARHVFLKSGYAGATVREIAAAADVNDAVLYRYFNTKEQLFEEAVAGPLEEAVGHAFRPAPGDAEVREVSEAFVRDLLDAMRDIAPLLLIVLGDAERGAAFYRDRFEPALGRLREAIDTNLPEWAHRDFDPDLAMLAVCGMCWFIALHNRFGTTPTGEPDDIAPEVLSIVWDGLRARD